MADDEIRIVISADDQASDIAAKVSDALGGIGTSAGSAGGSLDTLAEHSSGLGEVLSSVGEIAAGFLTANVIEEGFSAFTGMIDGAIDAALNWNQANIKLTSILENTGEGAGVTGDQALSLADSLSDVTNYSRTTVVSAEDVLLRFDKIGKDIFPQATQAALDLAAATGTDASAAAQKLGRALEDPTKGLTALSRSGIVFSADLQEQIKTMAKHGDVDGADALILRQLEGKCVH